MLGDFFPHVLYVSLPRSVLKPRLPRSDVVQARFCSRAVILSPTSSDSIDTPKDDCLPTNTLFGEIRLLASPTAVVVPELQQ